MPREAGEVGLPTALRWWRTHWVAALAVVVALVTGYYVTSQFSASPVQPPRSIVLATYAWAPYVDPDQADGGPVTAIIVETLRRQGFDPTVRYVGADLAQRRTEEGRVFGTFPFIATGERHERFAVSPPIFTFDYVLFYDRERDGTDPPVAEAADLAGLTLGVVDGWEVWPELDRLVPDADRQAGIADSRAAFEALAKGEIDLLPEGLLSGRAVVQDPTFPHDEGRFAHVTADDPALRSTQSLHLLLPDTEVSRAILDDFGDHLEEVRSTPAYRAAEAALQTSERSDLVELVPDPAHGLVELFATEDARRSFWSPAGTLADVVSWPTTGDGWRSDGVMIEVKIRNGPARGRLAYVDARSIRLTGGSP